MTTRLSQFNNTGLPLPIGATFTGNFERSLTGLEISTFVNSSTLSLVTIEQSIDASNVRITDTFNYNPVNNVSTFSVPVALPFFRVKLFNGDIVDQSYLTLNTYIINTPPQQVVVAGGSLDVVVGGVVDVSGSVVASNLITETLATRRVDFLVAGDYYRVASVGLTSGAQWQIISGGTACVGGQSVPDIGRLFKCVVAGPAVAGGGECFDIQYTDDVSATVTNFPATQAVSGTVSLTDPTTVRVRDTYGDPIVTTAGNLMVGIGNIYTANPLHTIVDSGTLAVSSLPTLPAGTNVIGSVGLSTSANTIKIDQTSVATNGVRTIAPDTSSVRVTTASSTGVEVNQGGHLLSFLAVNTSATADAYVKLYDSVAAPIPASDVPFMISHVSRDAAARLPTLQVDTSNLKITNKLWVRAVTGAADTNTDVTGLSMDICFFVTAT
jgi:hypothetical protein